MNAGRELDALVAEKVMGVTIKWVDILDGYKCARPDGTWYEKGDADYEDCVDEHTVPVVVMEKGHTLYADWDGETSVRLNTVHHYSTDIAAAWEVVEKLPHKFWPEVGRMDDGRWYCEIVGRGDTARQVSKSPIAREIADTAPLAICLAALKVT